MKKVIEKRKRNKKVVEYSDFNFLKRMITQVYPSGIFSVISDTLDYWRFISEYIPRLKDDIMSRDGKVVVRPDTGNPVDVICGIEIENVDDDYSLEDLKDYVKDVLLDKIGEETPHGEYGEEQVEGLFRHDGKIYKATVDVGWNRHDKQFYYIDRYCSDVVSLEEYTLTPEEFGSIEVLWNIFGGTVNEKGYKELDPHIGLIYGDSITPERAKEICLRLEAKGFASTNVVLGIGSYSYTYVTRDTFGMAIKATFTRINGKDYQIFKAPKGDHTKKSHRGIPIQWSTGVTDGHNLEDLEKPNLYVSYFKDGKKLHWEYWSEVKERALS